MVVEVLSTAKRRDTKGHLDAMSEGFRAELKVIVLSRFNRGETRPKSGSLDGPSRFSRPPLYHQVCTKETSDRQRGSLHGRHWLATVIGQVTTWIQRPLLPVIRPRLVLKRMRTRDPLEQAHGNSDGPVSAR